MALPPDPEPEGPKTPHRGNPAIQRIIDNGTPTRVEPFTPAQPTKRKRTVQVQPFKTVKIITGKVSAAPARQSGLQASTHNQPDESTATGALMSAMAEFHRKQDARQEVLGLVARSLDNVVSTCNDTDKKSFAREITKHFSTYLNTALLASGGLWTPYGSSGSNSQGAGAPLRLQDRSRPCRALHQA
ncbi:hypothetical protein F4804DRAFT_293511 [Jackrogersella minutella]|nr:hypothetical protein F4804DRAFT_293511 [Jackrogersella minutella]